jgi:hypothetical protein
MFPTLGAILRVLNDLRTRGVVEQYALGGAAAAMWFTEPLLTEDLDVFCHLPRAGLLLSIEPIYSDLRSRGYLPVVGLAHADAVSIEGVPVQFLVGGPLVDEAIEQAIEVQIAGEPARLFDLEYLIAIALDVGRAKDRMRVEQLMSEGTRPVDVERLRIILGHRPSRPEAGEESLHGRWERFMRQRGGR